MTDARTDPAARLRGTSVGILTAVLAVASHGAAGGGWPAGAVIAQLALLAVTLGAVASTMRAANRTWVLIGLLGAGQMLGHALLAIDGHTHGSHPLQPGAVMLVAHLVAVEDLEVRFLAQAVDVLRRQVGDEVDFTREQRGDTRG